MIYTKEYVRGHIRAIIKYHGPDTKNAGSTDSRAECMYNFRLPDGEMGHCLVGQFFANEGIIVHEDDNTKSAGALIAAGNVFFEDGSQPDFEDDAMTFLARLQRQADEGRTWGEALVEVEAQEALVR